MNAAFGLIICIFVLVIVGMTAAFVLRNNYYKEVDELEKRKNTLSDRGVAEELAKVKELNMIGEAEEHFETWRGQWDEIVTAKLPEITFELMEVDEQLAKYSFHKAKASLAVIKKQIELAESQIESIFIGVNDLMGSYAKNNEEIARIKKTYKELKKSLLAHRHSFTLVEPEIEKQLVNVLENVKRYEELTSNGNYFEASDVIDEMMAVLDHLKNVMQELPQLQVECQTALPVQIDNITDGYKGMIADGYVLAHLGIEEELADLKAKNEEMIKQIKALNIDEVKQLLEAAKIRIDNIYDALEAEVAAKQEVVTMVKKMGEAITEVRAENKESKEETATVKLSYQLSDKEIETQKYVEKQLSILAKRYERIVSQIDGKESSYLILKEDVKDIDNQLQTLIQSQKQYVEMLQMLRADEMAAKEQLATMKHKIQETKRILTVSNLPGVPESYYTRYNEAREKMALVHKQLETKPLNMAIVNDVLNDMVQLVDNVYEEAITMVEHMYLVEQVIQYGNRYRSNNNRVAAALYKAEKLFREYEYSAALEEAAAAIDSVDPGAITRLQEIINERKTPLY
ncbi:MAG: septation ring formation regulator EzrA [Bacillaceae bacterium]